LINDVRSHGSVSETLIHSTAPGERRVDDGMHLLQQHVDSVALCFGYGNLHRIA
jgi:hypothetical protein